MQGNSLWVFLKVQGLVGLIGVVFFATQGELLAALYGFAISTSNVAMLKFTFNKAESFESPHHAMQVLYLSAAVRFVILAVLFVLGLQVLGLSPEPVVLVFVAMQIGQVFSLKGKRRLTD